jgi:hypothetical protein
MRRASLSRDHEGNPRGQRNSRRPRLAAHSPPTPSVPNRSCHPQMTVLAFPVPRMISAVPATPSLAPQTFFWGLFKLARTASNSARSAAFNLMWVLSCTPDSHARVQSGIHKQSKCQTWSTTSTIRANFAGIRSSWNLTLFVELLYRLRSGVSGRNSFFQCLRSSAWAESPSLACVGSQDGEAHSGVFGRPPGDL